MKKKAPYFLLLVVIVCVAACRKDTKATKICLHDSSVYYLKRWANAYTTASIYNADKTLQKTVLSRSHGYFQINLDFTYNLYSDGEPVNGKWSINDSCQFVLNPKTTTERKFSVIQLSNDSLTIRQTVGNVVYTEHYAAFGCPELPQLQAHWENVSILETKYKGTSVWDTKYTYPIGYFRLNPDASYDVFSNNVPFKGTWGISQPGCLLVLDKGKPKERSFDVEKLSADSLVIWRKDTVLKTNYLQYYKKRK